MMLVINKLAMSSYPVSLLVHATHDHILPSMQRDQEFGQNVHSASTAAVTCDGAPGVHSRKRL